MGRFRTKIRKARFIVTPYTAERMAEISDATLESVRTRIARALTVEDSPAPSLRPFYARRKAIKGKPALRDWTLTGRTLRSMKTLSAGPGKARIGFTDPESNKRAFINNARYRQFGLSGSDRVVLIAAIRRFRVLEARRVSG
jgi:hypothetical protein